MGVNKPEGVDTIRQEVRVFRDRYGMKEPTATGFLSFLIDPEFDLLVHCVLVEETKHTSKAVIELMNARRKGKLPGCIPLCLVRPK